MIDKVYVYKHSQIEDSGSIELFPTDFKFKDNLDIELKPSITLNDEFGTVLTIEVKLIITLNPKIYICKNKTEFILTGLHDFSKDEDKQILAELCIIAYHNTGQAFNYMRSTAPWNQEKLEQISIKNVLSWISSGRISLPS